MRNLSYCLKNNEASSWTACPPRSLMTKVVKDINKTLSGDEFKDNFKQILYELLRQELLEIMCYENRRSINKGKV
jgi:hypothetical protein